MKTEPTPFSFDPIAEGFFERATQYQTSIVFLTAIEIDVFNAIAMDSLSAEEIAKVLGVPEQGLLRLLNALVALKLLRKDGSKYSNTTEGLYYLIRGSPNYIGNLKFFRVMFERWINLTKIIKEGETTDRFHFEELSPDDIESILNFMNWRANRQAPEFVKYLDLSKVMRVLDLGCGPGTFGMEILKYNINIELTLFDLPQVIEYTEKFIERKGFNGFVQTRKGDFLKDDIGNNYDLVIISNVLRLYPLRDVLKILNKVFDSLKRRGKVVIQEVLVETNRVAPTFAALQSLELFLIDGNGDLFTEPELTWLLKESWFSDLQKFSTTFGTTIFIGTK